MKLRQEVVLMSSECSKLQLKLSELRLQDSNLRSYRTEKKSKLRNFKNYNVLPINKYRYPINSYTVPKYNDTTR